MYHKLEKHLSSFFLCGNKRKCFIEMDSILAYKLGFFFFLKGRLTFVTNNPQISVT